MTVVICRNDIEEIMCSCRLSGYFGWDEIGISKCFGCFGKKKKVCLGEKNVWKTISLLLFLFLELLVSRRNFEQCPFANTKSMHVWKKIVSVMIYWSDSFDNSDIVEVRVKTIEQLET